MKSHKKKELELLLSDWSFELPKGEKGDKGDKGDRGEKGKDGRDGIDGVSGRDGIDGKDGKDGVDGKDGRDGRNGLDFTPDLQELAINTINVMETQQGEDRIDASAIKNIEDNIDMEKINVSGISLSANQIIGLHALISQQNPGGSLYRLRSLLDVDVSRATSGSLLTYNGSVWVPVAPATPGKRVTSITSSAYPAVNTDECDAVDITALATNILSMSDNLTGTPANKQTLVFEIKDNGSSQAIIWGASFVEGGVILPSMTVAGKILTVGFMYSTANGLNKWRCIASAQEA